MKEYPYILLYVALEGDGIYSFWASGERDAENEISVFMLNNKEAKEAIGLLKLVECFGNYSINDVLDSIR